MKATTQRAKMQDGDEFKVGEDRYVVRDSKLYRLAEVEVKGEVAPQPCILPHYAQWWPQPCNRPHYPYYSPFSTYPWGTTTIGIGLGGGDGNTWDNDGTTRTDGPVSIGYA